MIFLECLLNSSIQRAENIHDYVQLHFDNSAILNIFSRFRISGLEADIAGISGLKVSEISDRQKEIILKLSDGRQIEIGYNDEDYSGPEALELIDPDGQIVVWP